MEQVRVYFHYHPTYYILHLHIVAASMPWLGALSGKALLLDDVIQWLDMTGGRYFLEATLHAALPADSPVAKAILSA